MELVDLTMVDCSGTTAIQCKSELSDVRWKNGFVCRACGHRKAYFLKKRAVYECASKACKKQTSATAGTQFHHSRVIEKIWTVLKQKHELSREVASLNSKRIREIVDLSHRAARKALFIIQRCFQSKRQTETNSKIKSPDEVSNLSDAVIRSVTLIKEDAGSSPRVAVKTLPRCRLFDWAVRKPMRYKFLSSLRSSILSTALAKTCFPCC